jgi:PAS domain S-box-containing protein
LAILLNDEGETYRVVLARGRLAADPHWQEGSHFGPDAWITGQMAARHRPLYLPWHLDELDETEKERWGGEEMVHVDLFVPMHLRGSLIGWFALGPQLSDLAYDHQSLDFLGTLADQACVALENARLYGEMQQRATELAMLAMVSSAISSSLDLEQVLQTIVESVVKVINCDKSAIFELSQDGQSLKMRMSKGLSQAYLQNSQRIPLQGNNRGLALTTGEPLIVPDVLADPRLLAVAELAREEGYRAIVDLPLIGREGVMGILSVFFGHVHHPSASEMEILTTFANQATIAIENARLYATATHERDRAQRLYERTDAALARRVEELTAIEEISRQLTSTLELQEVMDLVLERSLQATQADRGVISLYDAEKDDLRLLAQEGFPPDLERYRVEPWSGNKGITGRVAYSRIPALVPDVSQDPDYVTVVPSTRSQISVPIVYQDEAIGTITLESDRGNGFTDEHLHFAELLADHAAIGIHNAQLFHQVMEGRDRLQAILNSTRDGVLVFDTAGRVLLTNPRVSEMLGSEVEDWLWSASLVEEARHPRSAFYGWTDLDPRHMAELSQGTADPDEQALQFTFGFRKEARQLFIEVTVTPVVNTARETLGWVAVVRDMTRQQELENFREGLTSMVVHNLQGPLAAIIGSLETFFELERLDEVLANRLLHIALESGKKLYSRIDSLLWLRRLEDSQIPLNPEPMPLDDLVQATIEEYLPTATMNGVTMISNLPPDLPAVVIDGEVISRVLSNLLDNALKYTPAEGKIEVQASLQPGVEEDPPVVCAVVDTGPGIAPEVKEYIFAKFHRGQESWRGRRRGMGIGLHYCKLAVEAHGGNIWVESQEGQGSAFCFTLPSHNGSLSSIPERQDEE